MQVEARNATSDVRDPDTLPLRRAKTLADKPKPLRPSFYGQSWHAISALRQERAHDDIPFVACIVPWVMMLHGLGSPLFTLVGERPKRRGQGLS
ncbi:hypothetical protein BS50DRAFT_185496 [Corynespora cassiicola Philippines]|uniref:Uncharacterized protein n=1 Tax=Corynespora cassiicola Philippines TaxID=1448308 RepID=A0A2T2P6L0_CORCC|nr:hypothetical protein BS50DRAFT_185496 [Corynespora cassiicola Philippines]